VYLLAADNSAGPGIEDNASVRHCQLNGKSSTDAFPSKQYDGVPMAKIQRFVKEHNQQEFLLYCTNV
jgi:hypothetical protein